MHAHLEGQLSYLQIYLEPLEFCLDDPDITDIYINRPGEIWFETIGGATRRLEAPDLTEALLSRLARQIASITHQGINRQHPLLGATLPNEARIQIVAPPATRGPMAIAIRKHVAADFGLDELSASGMFHSTRAQAVADSADRELDRLYREEDWSAFMKASIRARKTIVISGGTSTGKTTFLNALLREIPPDERLIAIEDAPELALRHENSVGFVSVRSDLGESQVSADDLLIASLRMRPDRIILGEIRGREAFTFLRAVNVGHPGSLTTIHADTPERAVDQLALLVLQTGSNLRREDVEGFVHASVDVFVQLQRRNGRRSVSEIRWRGAVAHPAM